MTRVFLGPNNQFSSDNDSQTGMMLDRVLAYAARQWFRRFRGPLAHSALVNRRSMHDCLQAIIQRNQYPTCYQETERVDTNKIVDDWDKLVSDANQRATEDVLNPCDPPNSKIDRTRHQPMTTAAIILPMNW